MIKRIAFLLPLVLSSFLFAQAPQIEVSGETYYSTVPGQPDTFKVYLQSLTGNAIDVRSATLSILHNSSCASYSGTSYSLFRNLWAGFFESVQTNTLATPATAGGYTYNRRLMYGNTSATTPPVFLSAPAAPAKIEVLSFTFTGACTQRLYLEDRTEFFPNGLGDPSNNYIPFRVKRTPQLPVEYLSLEARAINNTQVDINWTTAQEINSAYFEIEKSFDADFSSSEIIGQVQAAVTSETATDYSFSDLGAMASVVYYRLNQVDLDGQVHTSNSMIVNFSDNDAALDLVAFPNPFNNNVTIRVNKGGSQQYTLRILDMAGRVHFKVLSEPTATFQDNWKLELGHLPRGVYLVQVTGINGESAPSVFKLIK